MAGATLAIKIIADAAGATKTLDDTASRASQMGAGFKAAALPAAAVAASLGVMAKSAADDAQAQAVLAQQLRNTTGANEAQVAAVEDWIAKTALATGVADDQLRPAMAALARATGDTTTAQQAMGTALDVAAATGKPVESVADALAKAYAGQTTALGKLVPGMDRAVLASGDMSAVMGELERTTGGAAAAAADTAAGSYQRMTVAMDEAKESAGAALLPAMSSLAPVLASVAGWATQNETAVKVLVIALASLSATVLAVRAGMAAYNAIATVVKVATMGWTAVQWLLNVALTANPIGIVIAVIVLLVAAIVLAWQKSDRFREAVTKAWEAIGTAAQWVWDNAIKPVIDFIVAAWARLVAAAGAVAAAVVAAWNGLKAGLAAAWGWIQSNVINPFVLGIQRMQDIAEALREKLVGVWNTIKSTFQSGWDFIKGIFDSLLSKIQTVIDWIGRVKVPDFLSGLVAKATGAAAPAVPTGRAARTTGAGGGGASGAGPVLVAQIDVTLDGARVGGFVDRVVTRRLDDEGALLLAGAWGAR